MINKQTKIYTFTTLLFFVFFTMTVFAAGTYVPLEQGAFTDLGVSDASSNLGAFLGNIFNYVIAIAVVLALIMIIWGGIEYMTTDSWSGKDAGKERIVNALTGLGIALASWLILYTINPDLVTFQGNTFLNPPEINNSTSTSDLAGLLGAKAGDSKVTPCSGSCVRITEIGLACKPQEKDTCTLNATLATKLKNALSGTDAYVTEGYPPTVKHLSFCHTNGTCADVNFKDRSTDPQKVKDLYSKIVGAGLSPTYEAPVKDCPKYIAVGVKCISPSTMTAPSFHVNM